MRTRNSLGFACVALLLSLLGAADLSATETRDAILLKRTNLMTPPEMLGQDLAPEVQVSLDVDARGRVTAVAAQKITPNSEFDSVLREHVQTSLTEWRFAPALAEGVPQASSVQLLVQVRSFAGSSSELVASASEEFFLGNPERQTANLMRSSFDKRLETLEQYSETASAHLDKSKIKRTETPRFVVITESQDEDIGRIVGNNLEAAYNTFHRLFGDHLEPHPERYKMIAYMYESRASFTTAQLALRNTTSGAAFYIPPGFIALHREAIDPGDILTAMVHEAFHAFSDRKLRRPLAPSRIWLEEGLAHYFGSSQIKKGELIPGKTLHRKFLMHYGQVFKLRTRAGLDLQQLRQALKKNEAPKVSKLLSSSPQDFYGENIHLNYGVSWLLIHYLRHGKEGWSESQFPTFLLYLYEGYPPTEVLQTVYGLTPQAVEDRLESYVGKL